MFDFDNVLDDDRKKEGFHAQKDGCGVNLFFMGIGIARFNTDGLDLESVKDEIGKFLNKNDSITDYCYEFCSKFCDNATEMIKTKICFLCGGNCKRFCKYANLMLQNVERVNWMSHVLKN